MNLFQLWMSRAKLLLRRSSSESPRIRPSAAASGMVRNARRKLVACHQQHSQAWLSHMTNCHNVTITVLVVLNVMKRTHYNHHWYFTAIFLPDTWPFPIISCASDSANWQTLLQIFILYCTVLYTQVNFWHLVRDKIERASERGEWHIRTIRDKNEVNVHNLQCTFSSGFVKC